MKIGKIEICCGIFIGLHSDFLDEDMAILPTGPSKWPPLYGSMGWHFLPSFVFKKIWTLIYSRVTLHTARHLHTVVPHCSHSRAPIVWYIHGWTSTQPGIRIQPCPFVHTAVPPLCDIFTGDPPHSRALAHSRAPIVWYIHGWTSTQPGTCTQPCPIVHTAVPPLFTQPCPGRTMSTALCIYVAGLCASCPAV